MIDHSRQSESQTTGSAAPSGKATPIPVTWPGRLRQIHARFRARSPDQLLAAAALWTSPWRPAGYKRNYWNAALGSHFHSVVHQA